MTIGQLSAQPRCHADHGRARAPASRYDASLRPTAERPRICRPAGIELAGGRRQLQSGERPRLARGRRVCGRGHDGVGNGTPDFAQWARGDANVLSRRGRRLLPFRAGPFRAGGAGTEHRRPNQDFDRRAGAFKRFAGHCGDVHRRHGQPGTDPSRPGPRLPAADGPGDYRPAHRRRQSARLPAANRSVTRARRAGRPRVRHADAGHGPFQGRERPARPCRGRSSPQARRPEPA